MSDLTAVLAILATYGLLILCTIFLFKQGLLSKEQIVAGIVNGVPVSMKHRWNMLFFEFIGYVNVGLILHGVFAFGYFRAASIAGDSLIKDVALLCGAAAAFGAAAIVVPAIFLVSYMVSVLRSS